MKKLLSSSLALALLLTAVLVKPVKADVGILSPIGAIVGIPVGGAFGLLRGGVTKAVEYTDSLSDSLGGGIFGHLIGVPGGFVIGTVTGGTTGLIKGVTDGLVIGIDNPLSEESLTLNGKFTDYDPYDMFHSLGH